MKKHIITVGTRIDTLDGYVIVKHTNEAGLCTCDEYIADDEDPDKLVKSDEALRLMPSDIARRMREVDGLAHEVIADR